MNEEIKKFIDAVKADNEQAALEAGANIIGSLLNDVRRIADAIEAIAKKSQ
jgi:hypothetical protein